MKRLFALLLIAGSLSAQDTRSEPSILPWSPLYAGSGFDGLKQLGGTAEYTIQNGLVTGTATPNTPNSFLTTQKHYGDFVLEYEFKVDERLNSGVQIRSNSDPEYKNGRVHGYQVEIDPDTKRNRMWTAGIYDEGRRGWLNDLSENEAARKAFLPGTWNRVRVEAVGPSVRTWLNGVPAANLTDCMTMSGFIGLQVHGIGNDPAKAGARVQWRNVRIADLGRHVWRPLFNGKDLLGWKALPGGKWEVIDGVIKGSSPADEKRHGILLSEGRFGDFAVRAKFKVVKGDSGFYWRAQTVDSAVSVKGFQVEIDTSMETGGLYETGGRAWVVQTDPKTMEKIYRPGEWTDLALVARGGDVHVFINHRKTAVLKDDRGNTEGHFGLQLHGGQEMEVYFKDIDVLVRQD